MAFINKTKKAAQIVQFKNELGLTNADFRKLHTLNQGYVLSFNIKIVSHLIKVVPFKRNMHTGRLVLGIFLYSIEIIIYLL